MAKKKTKKKSNAGRPRVEIPIEDIEKLAAMMCTVQEIADFYGVCRETIMTRVEEQTGGSWTEFRRQFKNKGKISLRRWIWKKAADGNVPVLLELQRRHLDLDDDDDAEQRTKATEEANSEFAAGMRELLAGLSRGRSTDSGVAE